MAWTDERIDLLKKLWEEGLTASQIAEELGEVSRNAVIGKAHRLGLKARPSPVKANEPEKNVESAPDKTDAPAQDEPAAKPETETTEAEEKPAPEELKADGKPQQKIVSIGPGGFMRQGPGDQQPPIPPAPPRRLVPAKPSPEIADKTSLLELNERVCRWPMGHPGEADFHFCGQDVNPGFPYCVEHCGRAYQAQLPRGARRPPPPLPFGGPRVR
ncbi:GcrA family cell cycle regulator [Novosphingopyxis sp.]|uniref:GcrA family cell cycle regulator n=1 Tax=Novosphingopyxis sp. TaxID=2709690 RepID=UPI003B5CCE04